ncbi:S9 family peptidase [Xanthomonas rydalmerensis]|uniref:S9 family peptidase n=1 Tax=Xanthomonas rydalmerensis TaxID=3046274 RepID=A0ABZ0JS12_9XANT|nr:S9 family peptidase [Xanthomonas sp. DM-2023]WOS42627.1 S9 family peptidase [Xanthomonas sp. DM-2023]WOS46813.1 S9 family peptidase [Xanthomonas sp. DM-2023]WOS50993.1 S9 family peptidase [Xanthomonas sp. DM-2023]WOS55173.1 S9 family peptidase [Xanthomonas sp. DM-2023]WOS59355.1 S9 family peptidase [Xanthomonas sp. DM-2023]
MSMHAYHGDPQLRQQVIDQLYGLEHAGRWEHRPLYWNGEVGSVVGSLLQSDDLDRWEADFGLPKWLALAIDSMVAGNSTLGVAWGIHLLQGIPPGMPMDTVGSRTLLELLKGKTHGLHGLEAAAGLAEALEGVAALHAARLEGQDVDGARWRKARRAAVEQTNVQEPGSVAAAVGSCIEAAAWDPMQSRSAVSDTLRGWMSARIAAGMAAYSWSKADDDDMTQVLGALHEEDKASREPGDTEYTNVFLLLEQKHPEKAKRLRAFYRYQRNQYAKQWRQAALALQNILHAADGSAPAALIPRKHLFANPARAAMSISPDGQWLAWLADGDGVMNIWAAPSASPQEARQITHDARRGIQAFDWTYVPGMLLFSQDRDGDENFQLFGADLADGTLRALTPAAPGVRTGVQSISRQRRDEIAIVSNARDARFFDVHLLNLRSGELQCLEENPGFAGFVLDARYERKLAVRNTRDGGSEWLRRDAAGHWQPWQVFSAEDARSSGPSHFDEQGHTLYAYDSRGRDTAALVAIDWDSGTVSVLAEDPRADIGGMLTDAASHRPLAYGVTYERFKLHMLDEALLRDIETLDDAAGNGEWRMTARTEDDQRWIVALSSDTRPSSTWLYDRQARTLQHLMDLRPRLTWAPLARMQPVVIPARDGLPLVSYLTVPVEADAGDLRAANPLPLVLLVHGGPWSRDAFGFNPMHQWLANRGYAVLSVNFRGSTGFGKRFVNAADGEWGRKMDEDLDDAMAWALQRGIADPQRLAIFGASYGGYAVLSALTRDPTRYACGIDVVGPSNLETLLASIPAYWEADRVRQHRALGDPGTDAGRAQLRARSPLHRAAQIRTPLLIAQGANDPRVKQAESEQMVAALRQSGIAVTYALYTDEGHGFVREANRMSFNALCEDFLSRHLGGRAEAWSEADYPGHSLLLAQHSARQVA